MKNWKSNFDERQQNEIDFCRMYKQKFNHGTQGHNIRIIIAKMAEMLDVAELCEKAKDCEMREAQKKALHALEQHKDW